MTNITGNANDVATNNAIVEAVVAAATRAAGRKLDLAKGDDVAGGAAEDYGSTQTMGPDRQDTSTDDLGEERCNVCCFIVSVILGVANTLEHVRLLEIASSDVKQLLD